MDTPSAAVAAIFEGCSAGLPQYKAVSAQKVAQENIVVDKIVQRRNPEAVPRGSPGSTRTRSKSRSVFQCVDTRCNQTVFVGNIPASCTKKHIKQLFKPYGSIQSIRLRSIKVMPGDRSIRLARRMKKQLVEGSSFNAYVVLSSQTEAEKCLHLNGTLFHKRHIRVDIVKEERDIDAQRSVFIGNLPFSVDEEKLRQVFSVCGQIENVRIVRDPTSGLGKGFGFVTFVDSSGVMFALKQHGKATLDGRILRVCRSKNQQSLQDEKQTKLSGIRYNAVKPADRSMRKGRGRGNFGNKPLRLGDKEERSDKKERTGASKQQTAKPFGKRKQDGTKNRHRRFAISS